MAHDEQNVDDLGVMLGTIRAITDGRSRSVQVAGKVVTVQEAKMKHIPLIVGLFREIMSSIDQNSMTQLVRVIAERQLAAIRLGQDPDHIPMPEEELVKLTFGNLGVLEHITIAVSDRIPAVVDALSDLSADEYGELGLDEGIAILYAIFSLNYGFFTSKLLPTLRVVLQGAMAKRLGLQPQSADSDSKNG